MFCIEKQKNQQLNNSNRHWADNRNKIIKSSVYKKIKCSYINYLDLLYVAYPADILLEVYSINLKIPRTLYVVHWSSKKMHPILHKYVVENIEFHAWKVCKIEGQLRKFSHCFLQLWTPKKRALYTGVEWVEISQKIFARFFGLRMFLRS